MTPGDSLWLSGGAWRTPSIPPRRVAERSHVPAHQPRNRMPNGGLDQVLPGRGTAPPADQPAHQACPILGSYGGADPRITDGVPAMAEAVRQAGGSFEPHIYPDAPRLLQRRLTRPALYARAGIASFWRVELDGRAVRDPGETMTRSCSPTGWSRDATLRRGQRGRASTWCCAIRSRSRSTPGDLRPQRPPGPRPARPATSSQASIRPSPCAVSAGSPGSGLPGCRRRPVPPRTAGRG